MKLNKKFRIEIPPNGISTDGLKHVLRVLWDWGLPTPDLDDEDWVSWIIQRGTYAGTWPKRYASFLRKQHGHKIDSVQLAKIGTLASSYSAKKSEILYIDFTDHANWTPGTFGESNTSCWWNEYNRNRMGLFDIGGRAVRFFDKLENPMGRAWLLKYEQGWAMFNIYGKEGFSAARIVSTHLGLSYKKLPMISDESFINNNSGFLLGPSEFLESKTETLNLKKHAADYFGKCEKCRNKIYSWVDAIMLYPRRHYHIKCAIDEGMLKLSSKSRGFEGLLSETVVEDRLIYTITEEITETEAPPEPPILTFTESINVVPDVYWETGGIYNVE